MMSGGSTTPKPQEQRVLSDDLIRLKQLKNVLTRIISPDFKPCDDTVLEKLLSHLSQIITTTGDIKQSKELAVVIPWLCIVRKQWSLMKPPIQVFILKTAGLVARSPSGFVALHESRIIPDLCAFVNDDKFEDNCSLMLGFADLLCAVGTHPAGCQWMLESGVWIRMVSLAHKSNSLYTLRRSRAVIANLVYILEKKDAGLCQTILDEALKPIEVGDLGVLMPGEFLTPAILRKNASANQSPENRVLLFNVINLVVAILVKLLDCKVPPEKIYNIISKYHLDDWAWIKIRDEDSDSEFIGYCTKLLSVVNATKIQHLPSNHITYKEMRAFTLLSLKHITLTIMKHMFPHVLDVCVEYQSLWSKYGGEIEYDEEDQKQVVYSLENNLVVIQAMPLFICMRVDKIMESDVMDLFAEKVFAVSCNDSTRVCYTYRDYLRESPGWNIESLCLQGIRSLTRIISFCKKEQAVLIFQALMHTLKEFVPEEVSDISDDCVIARLHSQSLVVQCPDLLSAILDALNRYVSSFQFTWRDSLETICLMTFIQGLITNPDISPMLCAETLKLARLVITSFIPPNLALLVDTLQGSSMGSLGSQLFKKLHDMNWEVRDSSLEVLQGIASIADTKFPAFQALLLENDLPNVVFSMAIKDNQGFVRASALKCLREMVKIQNIWESALYDKKLVERVLILMHYEAEGAVRQEAALLITDIYKCRIIPDVMMERMFNTFYHITKNDFHWEVKTNSLEFWKSLFDQYLIQEGMIDGVFPAVTFSKEKKKIVTLNPPEIRSRIINVLRKLGRAGCLQVLWDTVCDDCDIEVSYKAASIINEIVELVNKYDVLKEIQGTRVCAIEPVYQFSTHISQETTKKTTGYKEWASSDDKSEEKPNADDVIEGIVKEEDIDLLPGLLLVEDTEKTLPQLSPRLIMNPQEFLESVLSFEVNKTLDERSKWIKTSSETLESLMEDILVTLEDKFKEMNLIDCY